MKKLKVSFLVLAFVISGMLSVRVSVGQTIQRTMTVTTAGPSMTSPPVTTAPVTPAISPWSWPNLSQPQIQQQPAPYRTYWINPNPTRIFPPLTKEGAATFWLSVKNN